MNKSEKRTLICASSNSHKILEMKAMLPKRYELKGLADIGYAKEIPETQNTIKGNAMQKVETLYGEINLDCFAEDTGLEVDALDGAPGVLSARFAGPEKDSARNMEKLLNLLESQADRSAQFRTVIALIWKGKRYVFEGIVRGIILESKKGISGFGYDPIFQPDGYDKSFGELSSDVKNEISHRAKAVIKLMDFLEDQS